jgi:hypothetical protein
MAKCRFFLIAFFMTQLAACAWAGSVIDMPIGDSGKVRYGTHGHTSLEGGGIAINELIYGSQTLETFGRLSFITGRGMGQSGDSLLYAPGGGFVIHGCIEAGGRCEVGNSRSVGVRGTFLSAKLVNENGKLMFIAQFIERLNPVLAALLGVPIQSRGTLELLLSNSTSCGLVVNNVEGGSLNILSEPSSLATLASSLFGLLLSVGACGIRRGNTTIALRSITHLLS